MSRSIPANRLSLPCRLYSWSRAKPAWMPGSGGKSGAVVAMAWIPAFRRTTRSPPAFPVSSTWQGLFSGLRLHDAQDLGHLPFELSMAIFKIVAHLVRLDFLLAEGLAQGPNWSSMHALQPARVRAHGAPTAASSTTHVDSRGPSPCHTPTTPTRLWPQA